MVVPVRATKLLYGLVCAPGQLQGQMTASPLVGHSLVGLQADPHRGCITDDGYQLIAIHEGLLLLHIDHLLCLLQADGDLGTGGDRQDCANGVFTSCRERLSTQIRPVFSMDHTATCEQESYNTGEAIMKPDGNHLLLPAMVDI